MSEKAPTKAELEQYLKILKAEAYDLSKVIRDSTEKIKLVNKTILETQDELAKIKE